MKATQTCPKESPDDEYYKRAAKKSRTPPSSRTMPPTSPRICYDFFPCYLSTCLPPVLSATSPSLPLSHFFSSSLADCYGSTDHLDRDGICRVEVATRLWLRRSRAKSFQCRLSRQHEVITRSSQQQVELQTKSSLRLDSRYNTAFYTSTNSTT